MANTYSNVNWAVESSRVVKTDIYRKVRKREVKGATRRGDVVLVCERLGCEGILV